jgi:hypothetical protein
VQIVPYDVTNTDPGTTQSTSFNVVSTGSGAPGAPTIVQSPGQLAYSLVPYPNPNKKGVDCIGISFQTITSATSNVFVDVYTLTGARVLHQSVVCPGTSPICPGASAPSNTSPAVNNNCGYMWALTNDQGGTVANGVYNLHVTVNNSEGTVDAWKKVMVLK